MDLYESMKVFLGKKKKLQSIENNKGGDEEEEEYQDENDEKLLREMLQRSIENESDHAGLYRLLEQIHQANTKFTLNDQVVCPNHRLQKQLDISTIYAVVDKMNKRRLNQQDWLSNSDQLEKDMIEWIKKCLSENEDNIFSNQRFKLSSRKEFDLFLCQLCSKSDRRMTNQDAIFHQKNKQVVKEEEEEEEEKNGKN